MVAADFFLSPEAQGRKADLSIWGDPTVLAQGKLTRRQGTLQRRLASRLAGMKRRLARCCSKRIRAGASGSKREWKRRYAAG